MTIYYVDATLGDNSWTGEHGTPQNGDGPWETFAYAKAQSYSAGDTIKFKRGETWVIPANGYWNFTDSGNAENYITVEDYGEGTLPIFDCELEFVAKTWGNEGGNVWSTAWTATIHRCRLDGVDSGMAANSGAIDGTTYLWHWNTTDDKLFVYATEDPSTLYNSIKIANANNEAFDVNGCSYVKFRNFRIHGGKFAFWFHTTADESYIEFDGLDIWYGFYGIYCAKTAGGGGTANNITVKNCDIDAKFNLISTAIASTEQCSDDGVLVFNECNDWTIQDNTFGAWGHCMVNLNNFNAGATQGVNDCIVENNTFDGSGGSYGCSIQVTGYEDKCTGNVVRYNIIRDMSERIQFGGNDNEFYYNLIYDIVDTPTTNKADISQGIWVSIVGVGKFCDGALVYNNVFYNTYNEGINIENGAANCLIKNNIFMKVDGGGNYGDACIYVKSDIGTGNVISNNCFYDADTSDTVNYQGTAETVAEADAGRTEFSSNVGSDPAMTNPGSADFTLSITSPCLNAGTDVSLTTDYAGNSVLAIPDIGAYEHQGVEAAPGQNGLHLSMGMGL